MGCIEQKLKELRDDDKLKPADLKAARTYMKGEMHHSNMADITESVIEDSGLFMELVYQKNDREIDTINEADVRVGKSPLTVHGVTKDTAIVTYPNSTKGYSMPIADLTVNGTSMKSYLQYELHNELDAEYEYTKADKERIAAQKAYMAESEAREGLIYASEPGETKVKAGAKVLDAKKVNKLPALEKLAKELDKIDNIGTSDFHKEHLAKVMKKLFSGTKEPLAELNVILNEDARDNGGFIAIDSEADGIYLSAGRRDKKFGNDMSLIEKFVHELVHGGTRFGINHRSPEIAKQISLLKRLRTAVMKELTVEDMMGDVVMNKAAEKEIAKARIKYMNNNLEEFLAYALTHEGVIKVLQKTTLKKSEAKNAEDKGNIFEQLLDILKNMFDAALKAFTGKASRRTTRGDVLAMELLSEFAQVNKAVDREQKKGIWSKADNKITDLEAKTEKWLNKKEAEGVKHVQEMMATKGKKNLWDYMQIVMYAVGTEEGTPLLQEWLSAVGQRPEGFVQTVVRHLKKTDNTGNKRQHLTLMAGQLDMDRKSTIDRITEMVSHMFKNELRRAEKKALYSSMEVADGYTLVNKYGRKAKELYMNEDMLNKEIEATKEKVRELTANEGDRRYVVHQAKGLATLMVTGKASIVQRRNAEAIVEHATGMPNAGLAAELDTLASLYAVQELDSSVKEKTAEMFDKEAKGIEYMARQNQAFKGYVANRLTVEQKSNMMKNYHREEYNTEKSFKIAKVSDKKSLKEDGYDLVEEIPNNGLGQNIDQLGLYVSDSNVRDAFDRSSFKYVGDRNQGRLLKEDIIASGNMENMAEIYRNQLATGQKKAAQYEAAVRAGKVPKIDTNVIPEVDETGMVIDYRAMVSIENKVKHLGLETNPIGVAGRNYAHEADMEDTNAHNELVWDDVISDMMDNAPMSGTRGKNGYEYAEISKDSGIFEIKDAARILPKGLQEKLKIVQAAKKPLAKARKMQRDGATKKAIKDMLDRAHGGEHIELNAKGYYQLNDAAVISVVGEAQWDRVPGSRKRAIRKRLGRGNMMVRRDMVLDTFGIRDMSSAEFITGKYVGKKLAAQLRKVIRQIEGAWKEVVKIFKVDMIIRMLPVIVGNIVSNLMYSIQYGLNPISVAKRQLEGVTALKDYLADKTKLTQLHAKLAMDPTNQKLRDEMDMVLSNMKLNPAMPLLDAGLYQHIVEDVGLKDFKSSSKIARWIDDNTEGVPELVKTGAHWMFISEKTSLFQLVTKATAYSDFVARYAQFTLSKEKEMAKFERANNKEMSDKEAKALENSLVLQVRDAYVNYAKPDSRLLQYFNDMGFVAFTKYAVRIQQSISELLRGKPLKFALAMIGQELFEATTGWNPDDIAEKSIFTRGPSSWFYTPGVETIVGNIIEPQMWSHMKAIVD